MRGRVVLSSIAVLLALATGPAAAGRVQAPRPVAKVAKNAPLHGGASVRARAARPGRASHRLGAALAGRGASGRGRVVIDVGGEGKHPGAINLNPGRLTSTTGEPGRPIPRLVQGVGERMPLATGSADRVLVESAPLRDGAAAELARVIKPGGTIRLAHPADYARKSHGAVIRAVGGRARQRTVGGMTVTIITAPDRAPPRRSPPGSSRVAR